MARNEEKAMSMLNRWVRQKQELGEDGRKKDKQFQKVPNDPKSCTSLIEAEMFRKRVVGGVIKRVSQIQNAALAEARIRELNDEINQILKVKGRWENRIKQLGGPDYKAESIKNRTFQVEGTGLEAEDGYMYFGAAKNLPQVSEIFKKEVPQAPLVNKNELLKAVDFNYLGLGERDLELEQKEKAQEQILLKKHSKDAQNEFIQRKRQKLE